MKDTVQIVITIPKDFYKTSQRSRETGGCG